MGPARGDATDLRLALDIGGTNIRAAIVTSGGKILNRRADATPASRGAQAVLTRLFELCDGVIDDGVGNGGEPPVAAGVSFGGPVLPDRRTILRSQHVAGWEGLALADKLESRYGLPVVIENDANAAAYGEFRFGAGAVTDRVGYTGVEGSAMNGSARVVSGDAPQSMLYVTVSTGIGGAVILNSEILRGESGLAGEIGHVIVGENGRPCSCGKCGCVEAYASGTSLAARAVEAGIVSASGTARDVYALADSGKPGAASTVACRLIEESVAYLATAIGAALSILDIHLVVVGGGVTRQGPRFFGPLEREVRRRAMFGEDYPVSVRPAQLGDDSGLLGAAALSCTDSR